MVCLEQCGAIAQLGERLNGIQEVVGSIPIGSTSSLPPNKFFVDCDLRQNCFACWPQKYVRLINEAALLPPEMILRCF